VSPAHVFDMCRGSLCREQNAASARGRYGKHRGISEDYGRRPVLTTKALRRKRKKKRDPCLYGDGTGDAEQGQSHPAQKLKGERLNVLHYRMQRRRSSAGTVGHELDNITNVYCSVTFMKTA